MEPTFQCTCGALKACKCDLLKRIYELEARNHLLQFLMGLNGSYDTQGQILSMDPLPSVNRAYYIIQHAEKQQQVTDVINVRNDYVHTIITYPIFKLEDFAHLDEV